MATTTTATGGMLKGLPPGPQGLPLVGNAPAMLRDILALLRRGYAEFGPVFTISMFRTPLVILIGAEAQRYLMVENPANFLWRDALSHLVPLLGGACW